MNIIEFIERFVLKHGVMPNSRDFVNSEVVSSTSVWKSRMERLEEQGRVVSYTSKRRNRFILAHLDPRVLVKEIVRLRRLHPEDVCDYEPLEDLISRKLL